MNQPPVRSAAGDSQQTISLTSSTPRAGSADGNKPTFIFAGGGTGGHLYPGLAVANELLGILPDAQIVFACSNRQIDRRILDPLPLAVVAQPVRPFPGGIGQIPGFVWAYLESALLAQDMLRDLRPAAVLGLGGFAAGPVLSRAALVGIPTAMLNPDAVPGKANRLLARKADVIFTQFPQTAEAFPPSCRQKVRCVGCPIRAEIIGASRLEAIRHFGLEEGKKTLLVFGGSLSAESISLSLERLGDDLAGLRDCWQVLHVSASLRAGRIEQSLSDRGMLCRTLQYCQRMDLAYAVADLVLCRAGAVSVAELSATACPAVLMPYPHHADQHQRLNAVAQQQAGSAVVVEDSKDPAINACRLKKTLVGLMKDPLTLEKMRRSTAGLAGSGSAGKVAHWLAEKVRG